MRPRAAAGHHGASIDCGPAPDPTLPLRLAERHAALPVGARLEAVAGPGWPPDLLDAVVVGAGFATSAVGAPRRGGSSDDRDRRLTLERQRTLADVVGPGMRLLLCGLNPSLYAADAGVGFARPGNRFWPAALAAGIVSRDRDPQHALDAHGVGMTDLVKRATPRADALATHEYVAGLERLRLLVSWLEPDRTCVIGLSGWRAAADRRATAGWQAEGLGGRPLYLMPNPSGLNASSSLDDLTDHLVRAAGDRVALT